MTTPLGVAIIGCGNIAGPYATDLISCPEIDLIGAFDVDPAAQAAFAAQHRIAEFASLDEVLGDDRVHGVVNLTAHFAHYEVSLAALRAGKHVYSEKPLALTAEEAQDLVRVAAENDVRLAGSPSVWLGPAAQTAWREVAQGTLGTVRVAYANVDHGRIETWHPSPAGFYDVGPVFDVAVYPIALLSVIHGPVRQVTAVSTTLLPERVTKDGSRFTSTADDFTVAMLTMADGALVRLTCSFYVNGPATVGEGIELHGDDGSLTLASWAAPRAAVRTAPFGGPFTDVELAPGDGGDQVDWSRGIRDLARAIDEDRPHRASGEHAAHVVDVVCAIQQAGRTGQPVSVSSAFPAPEPIGWNRT